MTTQQIHATAFKLARDRWAGVELSPQQEWFWDMLVNELEYRQRRAKGPDRCSCDLCRVG